MLTIPSLFIENNNQINQNMSFPFVIAVPFFAFSPSCFCNVNIESLKYPNNLEKIQFYASDSNYQSNLNLQSKNVLEEVKVPKYNFCEKSEKHIKKNGRTHFTREEDEQIKELVHKFGSKNWIIIASFMKGRTAKQCRDRYTNYLIPGYFQGEWSEEEDQLLLQLYNSIGTKWSLIKHHFPHRSSNSIKNRWHYFLSKKVKDKSVQIDEEDKEKAKVSDAENIQSEKINEKQEQNLNDIQSHGEIYDIFSSVHFEDEWIEFN